MSREIQEVKDGLLLLETRQQEALATANATTGKTDTDLTSAVGSLVEGFGQGGDEGFVLPDYATESSINVVFYKAECPTNVVIDFLDFGVVSVRNMFYYATGVEYIKLICKESSSKIDAYNFVLACKSVKIIDLTEFNRKIYQALDTFNAASSLVSILGKLDFSSASSLSTTFVYCLALEDVELVEGSVKKNISFAQSPKLSDASIQSIVDGFADMTGQTAIILTVHPTVKAKIEANPTWLATLTSKNVTLA